MPYQHTIQFLFKISWETSRTLKEECFTELCDMQFGASNHKFLVTYKDVYYEEQHGVRSAFLTVDLEHGWEYPEACEIHTNRQCKTFLDLTQRDLECYIRNYHGELGIYNLPLGFANPIIKD